ncbi:hypothetical protein [Microvirga sp. M2]|uniref:hypothetical protein n=1 Tax=Microvirga sp. M2 TaxID=3073270 RepID=UPI0039C24B3D
MLASAIISIFIRLDIQSGAHAIGLWSVLRSSALALSLMLCLPLGYALAKGNRQLQPLLPLMLTFVVFFAVSFLGKVWPFAVDGLVLTICFAGLWLTFPSVRRDLSLPLVCCICAIAILLAVNHLAISVVRGYAHPLGFEQALMGELFKDTLYHAAIAGLFQQYGTVSIGLDGLQPIIYHVASHWFIGGLARWTGLSTIQAYSLFVPILGGPLLLFYLLATVAHLRPADSGIARYAAMFIVTAITVGLGHFTLFGVFWVSESYLVSLWFFLLTIQTMIVGLPSTIRSALPLLFCVAVLVTMTSITKISTGAVLSCGAAVWIAWRNPKSLPWTMAGAAFAFLPFLLVYMSTYSGSGSGEDSIFRPFVTFRRYGYNAYFLPTVFVILLFVGWRRYPREPNNQALLMGLGAMMLASIASSLILDLPAGAVFYFVNPGIWAALCILAFCAWPKEALSSFSYKAQIAIALIGVTVVTLGTSRPSKAMQQIAALREDIKVRSDGRGTQGLIDSTLFGRILTAIDTNPQIDGVHVSPEVSAFWLGHTKTCWASSLMVQALASRPLLKGLHPMSINCRLPMTYGWADYKKSISSARSYDDASLCNDATQHRMHSVLQVLPNGELRVVDCTSKRG